MTEPIKANYSEPFRGDQAFVLRKRVEQTDGNEIIGTKDRIGNRFFRKSGLCKSSAAVVSEIRVMDIHVVPKRTQLFDKTSLAIEVGGILFWSAKKSNPFGPVAL